MTWRRLTLLALALPSPDDTVKSEVSKITQNTSIPVFGFNAGGDSANQLKVDGYVAMDEYMAGQVAAEYFLMAGVADGDQGLFVNSELNNVGLDMRALGLTENIDSLTFDTLIVDGDSDSDMASKMDEAISGCIYTHIFLSTANPVPHTINAIKKAGCSFDNIVLGTVDVSEDIFNAISDGELDFTISQQTYLQGALPVVMATLFAYTGQALAPSSGSPSGIYLSGPLLINATNLPTKQEQICSFEAFPVCPSTLAASGETAQCSCFDRSTIKLRGITHGLTTDPFWDPVYAAMAQAAEDFGIDLETVRLDPNDSTEVFYQEMASLITDYCNRSIHGLFASIPNSVVADAVSVCIEKGIPVVSINAGSTQALEIGVMNHVGQLEFSAGKKAGEQMIQMGVKTGTCLMYERNNSALIDRCAGMEEAFKESTEDVTFFGATYVPPTNQTEYALVVEDFVKESGNWTGWGFLLGGALQVPSALALQKTHSAMLIATFDTSEEIFAAIDDGRILFAVDQNAYLQGYFPIPLLTWRVYAQQSLVTPNIETGPRLLYGSPSSEEAQCQASDFSTCAPPDEGSLSSSGAIDIRGFAALAVSSAALLLSSNF